MISLNKEWEWKFYDDDNIQTWMRQHFSGHVCEMYNSIQVGAAKADLWRYCVLYIHGGVYLDIKTVLIQNIDTVFTNPRIRYPQPFFSRG